MAQKQPPGFYLRLLGGGVTKQGSAQDPQVAASWPPRHAPVRILKMFQFYSLKSFARVTCLRASRFKIVTFYSIHRSSVNFSHLKGISFMLPVLVSFVLCLAHIVVGVYL